MSTSQGDGVGWGGVGAIPPRLLGGGAGGGVACGTGALSCGRQPLGQPPGLTVPLQPGGSSGRGRGGERSLCQEAGGGQALGGGEAESVGPARQESPDPRRVRRCLSGSQGSPGRAQSSAGHVTGRCEHSGAPPACERLLALTFLPSNLAGPPSPSRPGSHPSLVQPWPPRSQDLPPDALEPQEEQGEEGEEGRGKRGPAAAEAPPAMAGASLPRGLGMPVGPPTPQGLVRPQKEQGWEASPRRLLQGASACRHRETTPSGRGPASQGSASAAGSSKVPPAAGSETLGPASWWPRGVWRRSFLGGRGAPQGQRSGGSGHRHSWRRRSGAPVWPWGLLPRRRQVLETPLCPGCSAPLRLGVSGSWGPGGAAPGGGNSPVPAGLMGS